MAETLATWDIGSGGFLAGSALILVLATGLRFGVAVPQELEGGSIERLYIASALSPWESLLHPADSHHPGLWPALIHWPFVLSGHSVVLVATFVRICALLAVPLVGVLVLSYAGRVAALLAMLDIALLPLFAVQAQEVSDVTLFITIAIAALWCYARALEKPAWGRLIAFSLLLTLSLHASYSAIPLVAAITVHALWNRDRRRIIAAPLLLTFLLAAGPILFVVTSIPRELALRDELVGLPWQHWGKRDFFIFLRDAAYDYFTPDFALLLVPALIWAVWSGRSLLRGRGAIGAALLAYVLFLTAEIAVREKTYYALMLPILALILVASLGGVRTSAETMDAAASRRLVTLATAAACAAAFAMATAENWERQGQDAERPSPSKLVVEAALKDGARTLVFDRNWTASSWNFFVDPYGAMARCRHPASTDPCMNTVGYTQDAASGRRVTGLVSGSLEPGWEEQSLTKFKKILTGGDAWLLVDHSFPDAPLSAYVEARCRKLAEAEPYQTWHCPRDG